MRIGDVVPHRHASLDESLVFVSWITRSRPCTSARSRISSRVSRTGVRRSSHQREFGCCRSRAIAMPLGVFGRSGDIESAGTSSSHSSAFSCCITVSNRNARLSSGM